MWTCFHEEEGALHARSLVATISNVTNRGTRRWPSGHRHPTAVLLPESGGCTERKKEMINISIHVLITSNVRVIKMIRQLMVGQSGWLGRKSEVMCTQSEHVRRGDTNEDLGVE